MAKDKSFGAKLAKAAGASSRHCPECGELYTTVHVVQSVENKTKNGYRFKEKFVSVCKCNQNEVMS